MMRASSVWFLAAMALFGVACKKSKPAEPPPPPPAQAPLMVAPTPQAVLQRVEREQGDAERQMEEKARAAEQIGEEEE